MKAAPRIRTADVLAAWDAVPNGTLRPVEVAATLGVSAFSISGHITFLRRQGKIERVGRGVYRRTAFGERAA